VVAVRTITGYRDGKAIWSDNEPGKGRVAWRGVDGARPAIFGSIVIGHRVPKPAEPTSIDAIRKKAVRDRKKAEL
jgi:hypothetical protein